MNDQLGHSLLPVWAFNGDFGAEAYLSEIDDFGVDFISTNDWYPPVEALTDDKAFAAWKSQMTLISFWRAIRPIIQEWKTTKSTETNRPHAEKTAKAFETLGEGKEGFETFRGFLPTRFDFERKTFFGTRQPLQTASFYAWCTRVAQLTNRDIQQRSLPYVEALKKEMRKQIEFHNSQWDEAFALGQQAIMFKPLSRLCLALDVNISVQTSAASLELYTFQTPKTIRDIRAAFVGKNPNATSISTNDVVDEYNRLIKKRTYWLDELRQGEIQRNAKFSSDSSGIGGGASEDYDEVHSKTSSDVEMDTESESSEEEEVYF